MAAPHELKRSLSLTAITFYGLGTILGAGIYVLVGKVASYAGLYAPFAFLVAAVLAALTGLSYAELCARYPKSAGAALYTQHGFGRRRLSVTVGFLIILTGLVSAATLANGFVGYLQVFVAAPDWLVITVLVLALALWLPLVTLAQATSYIILVVFAIVNLALALIKRRAPRPAGIRVYPLWVPLAGFLTTGGFVLYQTHELLAG